MTANKYSIVIPTYNERKNLPILCWMIEKTFRAINLNWEIVIVDDASPDGTLDVAKQLQKLWGREHIVLKSRAAKLGVGSAYLNGLQISSGNFVIIMDADFSHHPKYIPEMIRIQRETQADIVTGTRYAKRGTLRGGVYGWGLFRKLTSQGANVIASVVLRPGVSDLTGSFRLYKREVLEDVIASSESRGYSFQMEIMVRAKSLGYKVEEYPITFVDRIYGDSKFGGNEIVGYLSAVIRLWWEVETA